VNIPVHSKSELLACLMANKDTIKFFGVKQLGLFGSFVSGKVTNESDIDLLIDFMPGKKSYDNFIGLTFFLQEVTGRKIELVTRESLSPYIGPRILKQIEHVGI